MYFSEKSSGIGNAGTDNSATDRCDKRGMLQGTRIPKDSELGLADCNIRVIQSYCVRG